jgi:NAD(P)-dependent dehydrogenase (short-subunit alcohol dehydrogenase family)
MNTISELMNLSGRRVLITGATGGIGQEICATIAELGGDLLLVDLPGTDFDPLQEKLQKKFNVKISCIECDLEIESERIKLLDIVNSNDDGLDVLINNAAFVGTTGLEGWATDFEQQSIETWRRAMEVNLTAVFHLSQGCAPLLRKSKGGSIVNVSSIYGVNAPDYSLYEGTAMGNPAAYAASKGGLLQLTRWLSTTLAPDIRVNSISPGGISRGQPKQFVERYNARTPLERMATEEDMKGGIAYLASDLSAYVTGQNLLIDGGWTAW